MTETLGFRTPEHTSRHQPDVLEDDLDRLTLDYMKGRADRIAATVAEPGSKHEAYKRAHERFVEREADPQLQRFGKLLLLAPLVVRSERRLGDIRQHMTRGQRLDRTTADERRQLVRTSCAYNQMWRAFLEEHQEEVPPSQAAVWLERAGGNNAGWAKRMVNGMATEIAAAKMLGRMEGTETDKRLELSNIRYGDLEQDLKGQDILFDLPDGQTGAVDVKTGQHRPSEHVSRDSRTRNILLSIDPAHIKLDSYEVDEQYASLYTVPLADALTK